MIPIISILAGLVLVNVILLKYSSNVPQRPSSIPKSNPIKIVHLQPHFDDAGQTIDNNLTDEKLKVSSN